MTLEPVPTDCPAASASRALETALFRRQRLPDSPQGTGIRTLEMSGIRLSFESLTSLNLIDFCASGLKALPQGVRNTRESAAGLS